MLLYCIAGATSKQNMYMYMFIINQLPVYLATIHKHI